MFMQVFIIPFLDNGGIIAGAVGGGIALIAIATVICICVLVYCQIKKKGKFIGSLNQITRFVL